MGKVALEGLEFFAYHGVTQQERSIGNRYQVDIYIDTDFSTAADQDQLEGTIDYATVAEVVESQMAVSAKLLEHIGQRITRQLLQSFEAINYLKVRISKYNPPIGHICNRAYIEIETNR